MVFVARFLRAYDLPLSDHLRAVGPPAALALGLAVAMLPFELLMGWGTGSRLRSAEVVVASVAVYALVYGPIASRLRFLPEKLALPPGRRRRVARRHP
jgi:hypothetical protein